MSVRETLVFLSTDPFCLMLLSGVVLSLLSVVIWLLVGYPWNWLPTVVSPVFGYYLGRRSV